MRLGVGASWEGLKDQRKETGLQGVHHWGPQVLNGSELFLSGKSVLPSLAPCSPSSCHQLNEGLIPDGNI